MSSVSVLSFSLTAGLIVFVQQLRAISWLSDNVSYLLILLAWVIVFIAIPGGLSRGEGQGAVHRDGKSAMWLAQGSLWIALGVSMWLLMLRPAYSRRLVGLELDTRVDPGYSRR